MADPFWVGMLFPNSLPMHHPSSLVGRLTPIFFCLTLAGGVRAVATDDAGAAARFEQADTDHDGRISRDEFIAGVKNKKGWWPKGQSKANTGQNAATPEMFTALDTNRDGYLSRQELENGRQLRENRGDNAAGASATRDHRPPSSKEKIKQPDAGDDRH